MLYSGIFPCKKYMILNFLHYRVYQLSKWYKKYAFALRQLIPMTLKMICSAFFRQMEIDTTKLYRNNFCGVEKDCIKQSV